jgi:hypothetical protein
VKQATEDVKGRQEAPAENRISLNTPDAESQGDGTGKSGPRCQCVSPRIEEGDPVARING